MKDVTKQRIKFTALRALRTMLVALVGVISASALITDIDWAYAISVSLFAGLVAVLTAMVDLPEVDGEGKSKVLAIVIRGIKTFGQSVIAAIPAGALTLSEVPWGLALNSAIVATLGTVLLGVIMALPEVPQDETK